MAIDGITRKNAPAGIDPAETRPKAAGRVKSKSVLEGEDRVSLSQSKDQFARIRQLVDSSPDVRSARIEELARAINTGSYEVDELELADAIIGKNWIDFLA